MVDLDNWLKTNRELVLENSLKSLGRTEKQLHEHIKILEAWLETQPHLPETPRENHLINSLLINKFSIENCKQRLDMYYTIRNLLPEIYEPMDSKNTLKFADILYFLPWPKRTADGDRITFVKAINTHNYDFYSTIGYCFNVFDLRMAEDICNSEIVVTDLQTANLAQLTIMTPVHMKKFVMILEKVYSNRVKQFHYVNCPSFAYSILTFLKSLMKPKLASRVYFHADSSKIGEILPLDLLPKDFGGSEISLYEMNELWKKKLAKNGDRFDALCKMKINEKLRPSPLVNDEILGFHGNFRKLEMD